MTPAEYEFMLWQEKGFTTEQASLAAIGFAEAQKEDEELFWSVYQYARYMLDGIVERLKIRLKDRIAQNDAEIESQTQTLTHTAGEGER